MFIFNENVKFILAGTFKCEDTTTGATTGEETIRACITNSETAMHDARRMMDERVNIWLKQSREYRDCGYVTWFEVTLTAEGFGSSVELAYYDLVG